MRWFMSFPPSNEIPRDLVFFEGKFQIVIFLDLLLESM